jgi:hypothetical protein
LNIEAGLFIEEPGLEAYAMDEGKLQACAKAEGRVWESIDYEE